VRLFAFALIIGVASLFTPSASAQGGVPDNLVAPSGHFTAFQLAAYGVQIYGCQAKADDPTAFEWTFRAPEATLMNPRGEVVGKHYAGPTWEGMDGSMVVGAARANADSPDTSSIPWLLLEAQSNGGSGLFSAVTYVQRLDTIGGKAPVDGCSATSVGRELRMPYIATYAFSYPVASME